MNHNSQSIISNILKSEKVGFLKIKKTVERKDMSENLLFYAVSI